VTKPILLRDRSRPDGAKVGMVELFFDLVFVFAVTQLSHTLLANLTAAGSVQVLLLMFAVWWVWIYTSWFTNWLDPDRIPVRVCLFALMLAGLMLSVSIPKAFAERGLLFAAAYASMQVGRTLFFLWAVRGGSIAMRRNFQRILAWLATAGVFWIVGGLAEGGARLAWWALALGLEMISPLILFWTPGLGRSTTTDWDIDGSHMAERCALFIIIALGESLLVTGATFAEQSWTAPTWTAFGAAILGSIAMWWIYFDTGAERAQHRITHSSDPGRHARNAYTYLHTPMVAGIIIFAVADEVILAHPDHGTPAGIATILGGPAAYLLGTALFKWVTNERKAPPLSHLVGLALLAALVWPGFAHKLTPLALGCATVGVLVLVAAWESIALRRR
jgi:low temperature requirement protein LtrA